MADMLKISGDNKISAVLNTFNASLYLEQVLDNLAGFDEIVVCDMESTDSTVDIARRKGCRVVIFEKKGISICEPARNFAIQSALNQWILVVDADEIVTPQLRNYLYKRIDTGCPDGLYIPRRNMFMGRFFHSSPDYQLRFFRKDKVDWPPVIHRPPHIDGRVEKIPTNLSGVHLVHLYDASLSDRLLKMNVYTNYEVAKRAKKNYGIGTFLFRPQWFFIRCLFIQGAVLDGLRGLIRAYMSAYYQIVLLSKIKEYRWNNGKDKNKA